MEHVRSSDRSPLNVVLSPNITEAGTVQRLRSEEAKTKWRPVRRETWQEQLWAGTETNIHPPTWSPA